MEEEARIVWKHCRFLGRIPLWSSRYSFEDFESVTMKMTTGHFLIICILVLLLSPRAYCQSGSGVNTAAVPAKVEGRLSGDDLPEFDTAACRYVARSAMIAEINYMAKSLRLPLRLPLVDADFRSVLIEIYSNDNGRTHPIIGIFETDKYKFAFSPSQHLCEIKTLGYSTDKPGFDRASAPKLGTNAAYKMASAWLSSMSVDVSNLESKKQTITIAGVSTPVNAESVLPVQIEREGGHRSIVTVLWRSLDGPRAVVRIDENTMKLGELKVWDDTVCRRPAPLIRDIGQLLEISDKQFDGMSDAQRTNLIVRHSTALNR